MAECCNKIVSPHVFCMWIVCCNGDLTYGSVTIPFDVLVPLVCSSISWIFAPFAVFCTENTTRFIGKYGVAHVEMAQQVEDTKVAFQEL